MRRLDKRQLLAYLTDNKLVNSGRKGFLQKVPSVKRRTGGLNVIETAVNPEKSAMVVCFDMNKPLMEYPTVG